MGNHCIRLAPTRHVSPQDIKLLMLGLDGAGKTTMISALRQQLTDALPTVGFAKPQVVNVKGYSVTLFDVGGGPSIRKIWPQYLSEVHGIVFVVDACDAGRFEEAKFEMFRVLEHPYAAGKHLLVLANKQDGQHPCSAKAMEDIVSPLTDNSSLVRVMECTAKMQSSFPIPDSRILDGMDWLLTAVESKYSSLNARVRKDHLQHMIDEAALRRERLQRGAMSKQHHESGEPDPCTRNPEIPTSSRLLGKVTGSATNDGHALGERFGWQVGMLSFGSLLGNGTYCGQSSSSKHTMHGCSDEHSSFQI